MPFATQHRVISSSTPVSGREDVAAGVGDPSSCRCPDALPSVAALVAEYGRIERLTREQGDRPGRGTVLDWDLDYPSPSSLLAFLDYVAFRRMNDFVSPTAAPTIVDCGANIGYTSLWYKRQFPAARIVALEPDPVFAGMLRKNLARNGAADVEVVEAAAWIRDGRAPWLSLDVDGSRLVPSSTGGCTVATVDLRRYLDREITLLKIDVEGAEFDLVPHLAPSLARVEQALIECHVLAQQDYSRVAGVLDVLRACGFQVALNSYGPWRDLIRRHQPAPHHAEQYLLVSAWRGDDPRVDRTATSTPYVGLGPAIESDRAQHELGRTLFQVASAPGQWEMHRLSGPFRRELGACWTGDCPAGVASGDDPDASRSTALVFEGDRLLGPAHAQHDDIRTLGGGRFSHWGRRLYFAASDNSDPNDNGRTYFLLCAARCAASA